MAAAGQGEGAGGGRGFAPDASDSSAVPAAPDTSAVPAAPDSNAARDVSAGPDATAALVTGAGSLRADLRRGLRAGLATFWDLIKMMVPAYFIALLLERLGVIAVLAEGAEPVMSLLGLPGEAAVPLVVGYVLNIYAAIGAMQALALSAQQVTVLAIAVLIGHNLLVEGVVLQRAGMNGVAFGVLRIVAGLAAAGVANLLMGVV